MMINPKEAVLSLQRWVHDLAERIRKADVSPKLVVHTWDSRGDEPELPDEDLIGIDGWAMNYNQGLPVVMCGVTVSTINDANLFRETDILEKIFEQCFREDGRPKTIPLRDSITGEVKSLFEVSDFEILPAGRAEIRNYRTVGLELKLTSGV